MQEADLKPLNGLYQLVEPPHDAACDRALIAVAQLRRKPPSKRAKAEAAGSSAAQQGALEWVVGVSAPAQLDSEGKGKGRNESTSDDWWERKMSIDDVTEWLQEAGGTQASPAVLAQKFQGAWQYGDLYISGYTGTGGEPRTGIELIAELSGNKKVSLVLSPCASPPLALESVLLQTIPHYAKAKLDAQKPAVSPTDAINWQSRYEKLSYKTDKLAMDKSRLEAENKAMREEHKRARKEAKRHNSGDSSQVGGFSGSPSPTKPAVPGETHRAQLRPGDPGYAGSRNRVGRITQSADFDPVSDSD